MKNADTICFSKICSFTPVIMQEISYVLLSKVTARPQTAKMRLLSGYHPFTPSRALRRRLSSCKRQEHALAFMCRICPSKYLTTCFPVAVSAVECSTWEHSRETICPVIRMYFLELLIPWKVSTWGLTLLFARYS